eukprot:scaffold11.g4008.t1
MHDNAPEVQLHMPAEAAAHKVCWLGWPRVDAARRMLPEGNIRVEVLPVSNSWVRDTGPTAAGAEERHCHMVVEGGAIAVDGEGTLITTEERFFRHHRKPDATKQGLQDKVIWLPDGLFSDTDTGGHVDDVACFVALGVVLLAWTDDESDPQARGAHADHSRLWPWRAGWSACRQQCSSTRSPHPASSCPRAEQHKRSAAALEVLEREVDAKGQRLRVEAYGGGKMSAGDRIPASYINLYIANGGVVVPAFGEDEADERARAIVEREFPG